MRIITSSIVQQSTPNSEKHHSWDLERRADVHKEAIARRVTTTGCCFMHRLLLDLGKGTICTRSHITYTFYTIIGGGMLDGIKISMAKQMMEGIDISMSNNRSGRGSRGEYHKQQGQDPQQQVPKQLLEEKWTGDSH
jgi:hypothetical protein